MPNFRLLPKHIILVRHGESEGNKDPSVYKTTPDYKISLTEHGRALARLAGSRLRDLISSKGPSQHWRIYFYVSPYERTQSTLREIGKSFSKKRVIGVREGCRIGEQDFGNFQVAERMRITKETRENFGRLFYRFPEGESAADVFVLVSSMLFFIIKFTFLFNGNFAFCLKGCLGNLASVEKNDNLLLGSWFLHIQDSGLLIS
ncbi:phosphoglycerate mutase-like protein AT74 [Hibiscus syriacus]|uniref:phosphoglycerate mutase-like protein AT74 n=1 Tax=Hibiscus syriacus TaxID=106335 RepID=UPI0019215B5F|nr:phosphoglycerate mutase-like protein AT74 [Hibiscus syriacus]